MIFQKNKKEDFKAFIGLPTSYNGEPFKVTLSSNGTQYVAEYDGKAYVNCEVAEGGILVKADNHGLHTGQVFVEIIVWLKDVSMPDKNFRLCSRKPLQVKVNNTYYDLWLTNGESDDIEAGDIEAQLLATVLKGDTDGITSDDLAWLETSTHASGSVGAKVASVSSIANQAKNDGDSRWAKTARFDDISVGNNTHTVDLSVPTWLTFNGHVANHFATDDYYRFDCYENADSGDTHLGKVISVIGAETGSAKYGKVLFYIVPDNSCLRDLSWNVLQSYEYAGYDYWIDRALNILNENIAKTGKDGLMSGQYVQILMDLQTSKQDKLTYDSTPTEGSQKPVTSNGIYLADEDVKEAAFRLSNGSYLPFNGIIDGEITIEQEEREEFSSQNKIYYSTQNSKFVVGVRSRVGNRFVTTYYGTWIDSEKYNNESGANYSKVYYNIEDGKNYKIEDDNIFEFSPLTEGQNSAINSGITSNKVSGYDSSMAELERINIYNLCSVGATIPTRKCVFVYNDGFVNYVPFCKVVTKQDQKYLAFAINYETGNNGYNTYVLYKYVQQSGWLFEAKYTYSNVPSWVYGLFETKRFDLVAYNSVTSLDISYDDEIILTYNGVILDKYDCAYMLAGVDAANGKIYILYKLQSPYQYIGWYNINDNKLYNPDGTESTDSAGAVLEILKNGVPYLHNLDISALKAGKQDSLSSAQLAAVNSGITQSKVAQIDSKATKSEVTALKTRMVRVDSEVGTSSQGGYEANDIDYNENIQHSSGTVGKQIDGIRQELSGLGNQTLRVDSVKSNGNIVLKDGQGNKKEYMAATPSGDPMHYAYVDCGATYNATSGYWELNGLTDITNEQMSIIYKTFGLLTLNTELSHILEFSCSKIRTTLPYINCNKLLNAYGYIPLNASLYRMFWFCQELEILALTPYDTYNIRLNNQFIQLFSECNKLKEIKSILYFNNSNATTYMFYRCYALESLKIKNLLASISFSESPNLTASSVAYMINNASTSTITITLHATAYARAMADADVQSALASKTNVTLASA